VTFASLQIVIPEDPQTGRHFNQRVIRLGLTDANREWQRRKDDRLVGLKHPPYIRVVRANTNGAH
jgi:hypothetical protein